MRESLLASTTMKERILVIGAEEGLLHTLRHRYEEYEILGTSTFLSGIAELSNKPAKAVIACVSPNWVRLDSALGGLREVVGSDAKIVLCCKPETEPHVRKLILSGADDYVLLPLRETELDEALGIPHVDLSNLTDLSHPPFVSIEELGSLGEILANLDDEPSIVLQRLLRLIQTALRCEKVSLCVNGSFAEGPVNGEELVLIEPLSVNDQVVGRVGLGSREGKAYGQADIEKVRHYARLAGFILEAASRHRNWKNLAMTDEITGLPNRRHFIKSLNELVQKASQEQFRISILLFDIDNFKTYNDEFGHDVGDKVLKTIADLFKNHTRDHDLVARYGGDEFAAIFWDADAPRIPGSRHPSEAMAVLQRCQEALNNQEYPMLGPNARGCLTLSGGLASFPWHAQTANELIHAADQALLKAKRAGKNRFILIGDEADSTATNP